jgi:hypothetical protein
MVFMIWFSSYSQPVRWAVSTTQCGRTRRKSSERNHRKKGKGSREEIFELLLLRVFLVTCLMASFPLALFIFLEILSPFGSIYCVQCDRVPDHETKEHHGSKTEAVEAQVHYGCDRGGAL